MDKNNNRLYITKDGLKKLKDELKELVEVKRPEIARDIQSAREMGDISENAAYDEAKREQGVVEGRISELEDIIKRAEIVESKKTNGKVVVGSKVTVHVDGDNEEYHIVGGPEADPLDKKISHESPLGSALMGKKTGEKVHIEAPLGKLTYTIIKIE
jgi:transcription elongation factor GreA